MPIEVATKIHVLNQEGFHALDRKLMRIIFDVHNEFGRFLNETLYKNEIAARWHEEGMGIAEREVRVVLTHDEYGKNYYMDTLFNSGLMLEAKVAESLTPACRAQGLNYLLISGMQHGRLVNLRPEKVEHEFLSTNLTLEKRRQISIADTLWKPVTSECRWMRDKIVALLKDWGAFLEIGLYRDALTHFLGGVDKVVRPINVYSGSRDLGPQLVHLLSPTTAFALTAINGDLTAMQEHQRRLLKHTDLQFIQWVNFDRLQIQLRTLAK